MRILFCGGGTGGHIYPSLAIAEAIKEKHPSATIAFAVRKGGAENQAVREKEYPMYEIDVEGLKREMSFSNVKTAWKLLLSLKEVSYILDNFRPDIVIGSGGYVCFPVIFKAQMKHIKTVLHESNAIPGLAIRLLSKKADRVFYSFPGTEDCFCDKTNLVLTGMPVRSAFCELTKEDARSALHIKPDDFLIVSFGGSLGSEKMNEAILSILFEEKTKPHLRHIHGCGSQYFEELKKKAPSLCQRNAKVKIVPYIKDMPKWMKSADLVISRSGASTIAEIATAGVPAIFIPSPNVTGNHQYENAKRLKDKKAAILIEEKDLTPEILQKEIDKMQKEKEISKLLTTNLSCFSMKNASKKMVTEIEELIKTP